MSYPQLLTPEEKLSSAKQHLGIPRIVAICGSTRFIRQMADADRDLTWAGHIVVKPGCDMKETHPLWADPAEAEAGKVRLDALHRAKIRLADEVLIVGNYIGDSTRGEIAYARELGKPVRFTHPEVDPDAASTSNCATCKGTVAWIDAPTGGWWAHDQHPADDHDAQPAHSGCTAGLMSRNDAPVERCVVSGGHGRHRSALGEAWADADFGLQDNPAV